MGSVEAETEEDKAAMTLAKESIAAGLRVWFGLVKVVSGKS